MNIDIINTQIVNDTGLSVEQVESVNKFYWRKVRDHIYDYNPQPLNIDYVCVLMPHKKLVKHHLKEAINKLRYLKKNSDFNLREERMHTHSIFVNNLLKMRKYHKQTN